MALCAFSFGYHPSIPKQRKENRKASEERCPLLERKKVFLGSIRYSSLTTSTNGTTIRNITTCVTTPHRKESTIRTADTKTWSPGSWRTMPIKQVKESLQSQGRRPTILP